MLAIDYESKKSIREAFGKKLAELGAKNKNIVVLDADLSCSTQTKIFAQAFPRRFFNCGIAEQNMITTATGLALTGKIAFAATFAMFATGRTYDQIRNAVCYQNANVKIIFLVLLFLLKINNVKHKISIIKHKIATFAQLSASIIATN